MYRTNVRVSQATKERYEQMGGLAALRTMLDARMGAPGALDRVLGMIIDVKDESLRGVLIMFAQKTFSMSNEMLMAELDKKLGFSEEVEL